MENYASLCNYLIIFIKLHKSRKIDDFSDFKPLNPVEMKSYVFTISTS